MNLVKLGDICDFFNGGAWTQSEFTETGYPVLKVSNCKNSGFEVDDVSFIPHEIAQRSENNKLHIGDVIIATVGSHPNLVESAAGRSCIVTKKVQGFYLNQNAVCLRSKDCDVLDQRYLGYLAASAPFKHYIQSRGKGAANQMRIAIGAIKEYEFEIPDIHVQRKIGATLDAYDDLIENNQEQIKLLEEAAQRLYKEWFVDLRFPGHETTPITGGIPEGWTVQSMNDIAEYINGYAFKPTDWGTVGKPIIKIKEMGSGVTTDTPRNTGEDIPEKYNVTAGDILFSWSATLSAMIWDEEDGLLNQHLFKVIPGEGISREFVLQSILKTLDEFSNLTTGSTMKHIQRGKLKEVKVNVPPTELMEQYRNISEPIREQILNVKRQIILLREARDRLLPKVMNGEIEV